MLDDALNYCSVRCRLIKQILEKQNNPLSTLSKYLVLAVLWFGSPLNVVAAGVGCDDAFVQLLDDEIVIEVAPTHSDDSDNIQCAFDVANANGVPVVRLKPATYFISLLIVENFKGTFEGRTREKTIIEVFNGSINCELMNEFGLHATAIKFMKGEPRVRFMTIRADKPCFTGGPLRAILHFTGDPTEGGTCASNVIFAVVDRVAVERTSMDNDAMTGVAVYPEGKFLGGCKIVLLGTFKLNRSIISNTKFGIVTSMRSSAQVDINFNEFRGNIQSIALFDTNQNTTITANKFFGDTGPDNSSNYIGVHVSALKENPPKSTRVVIHNNTFNVADSFPNYISRATAIEIYFSRNLFTNASTVITNNKLNLSGELTKGIEIRNTSNAHISANVFNGWGSVAILIGGSAGVPVSGVTITANKGLSGFSTPGGFDIALVQDISESIVGANQGASVLDKGSNNTVLPQ